MVRHPISDFTGLIGISLAILAAMLVTYFTLAYAQKLLGRIGPNGIDAATRIVGFFVSAIGMGLIFHGVIEGLLPGGAERTAAAMAPGEILPGPGDRAGEEWNCRPEPCAVFFW